MGFNSVNFKGTYICYQRGKAIIDLDSQNKEYVKWLLKNRYDPRGILIRQSVRLQNMDAPLDLMGELWAFERQGENIRALIWLLKYMY